MRRKDTGFRAPPRRAVAKVVLRFGALTRAFTLSGLARASKGLVKRGLRAAVQAQAGKAGGIPPEHFGLTRGPNGELSLSGVTFAALTERFGSPLHVVNAARLRDNARRFVSAARRGPADVDVFYSFKTNPVPGVIAMLREQGFGAEVISHYELWLAQKLGFAPDRIVYNGPVKSDESLREAIASDILLLNVNHREELERVVRIARELGRRPRVGVRVTVGEGWSGQFGTPVAGGLALRVFEEAVASGALNVVGLHAHRGGMLRSEADVTAFVDQALAFVEELHERLGLDLTLLNLGGSLASPSVRGLSDQELRLNRTFGRDIAAPEPSMALGIERHVALVSERVASHFATRSRPAPRVLLEPGRSVTSDSQLLVSQVQSLKADAERLYAILNAGINLADSCRSEYHQLFVASATAGRAERLHALAGPICTPGDTLHWGVRLPALQAGDHLLVMDAGAYFVPFSTSFSFPRPAIVTVDDGRVELLRRAETFDDLLAFDELQR
ncbi:MAG: pyridoxal-dependent decarboxylase [Myxococcales bacterium]|nr:MAG: pyridoxal-dependent decarboxylase [Myxococcales bacterium]